MIQTCDETLDQTLWAFVGNNFAEAVNWLFCKLKSEVYYYIHGNMIE